MEHTPGNGSHQDFRPLVVSDGRHHYPLVCKLNVEEILFRLHGAKQDVPIPWQQFARAGAAAGGVSPREFLEQIIGIIERADAVTQEAPEPRPVKDGDGPDQN